MVYRRRKTRRTRKQRRRTYRKRSAYGENKVYAFKRKCRITPMNYVAGAWVQSSINDISNSSIAPGNSGFFKFALDDLPNSGEFVLFEKYKITGVKIEFHPYIGTESAAATGMRMAQLAYTYNDTYIQGASGAPTFDNLLEDQGTRLRTISNRPFSLFCRPKAHNPVDGITQSQVLSPWINYTPANAGVDHYGVAYAFPNALPNDSAVWYKCYATYYIKCKGPR